jgi:excisionase family DNA binding protein
MPPFSRLDWCQNHLAPLEILMNDTTLLNLEQAADRLQIKPDTLRGWLRAGKLRGVKLGARRWRVREVDLPPFIETHLLPVPKEDG